MRKCWIIYSADFIFMVAICEIRVLIIKISRRIRMRQHLEPLYLAIYMRGICVVVYMHGCWCLPHFIQPDDEGKKTIQCVARKKKTTTVYTSLKTVKANFIRFQGNFLCIYEHVYIYMLYIFRPDPVFHQAQQHSESEREKNRPKC